jgi:putative FmdB family regulatory protein
VPLYEYRCKSCGHQFEKIQSFSAPEEKICPVCGEEVERLISAPAIQFKGAGWYVNDYAAKPASAKSSEKTDSSRSSDTASAAKSDSGSSSTSDSKPAASPNTSSSSSSSTVKSD